MKEVNELRRANRLLRLALTELERLGASDNDETIGPNRVVKAIRDYLGILTPKERNRLSKQLIPKGTA